MAKVKTSEGKTEIPAAPRGYALKQQIVFQGKVFRPQTVTREELEYLAKFPDEVPFLTAL